MSQRRLEKINGLLKEAIAELLLRKSKDPRLGSVNLTGVKVTADLKKAVARYSVLTADPEERAAVQKALDKAAGFVRASLSEELRLRYTPEIKFEFDRNLEYAQRMAELLGDLTRENSDSERDGPEGQDGPEKPGDAGGGRHE